MNQNNDTDSMDIAGLIKHYLKHWYLFVFSVFVCVALAYAYVKVVKPVYMIKANILIKQNDSKSGGGLQSAMLKNLAFGNMLSGGVVDDEVYIVNSHTVFRDAVEQLGLNKSYIVRKNILKKLDKYKEYPVEIIAPAGVEDTLSSTLLFKVRINEQGLAKVDVLNASLKNKKITEVSANRFPIHVPTPYGNYILNKTAYFPAGEKLATNIYISGYDMVAERWDKKIDIGIVNKKSNVIALSLKETDIARGKDILNAIIEIYNKNGITEKNLEAENTARFVNERKQIIEEELFAVEQKVEEYKKLNNLTDLALETKVALEQNSQFHSQAIELEAQRKIIQIIEDFLFSPENKYALIPFASGLDDRVAVEAIQQYNNLVLDRMKLLKTAKENSPTVELITEQVDVTRNNVLTTIKNHKESVDILLREMQAEESQFLARIKNMPTQEREFIIIKRQQAIKQELYLFLLQKEEENALTLAITTPKGQIIDAAYNLNRPVSPRKMITLFMALLMGTLLPVLYLYLKGILNTKFATKQELEALTAIPILGEICETKSKEKIVVKEGDTSSIAELFRLIRTNIQFILNHKNEKVILITSSISGEGKSFFSYNFGMSLALMNKKIILVDLDIRNSKLSDYLNISNGTGLTNYLASDLVEVDDVVVADKLHPNLDIILAGPLPPNPAELLLSDKLDKLFEYLREKYDYILVDSAPVGLVSDTFCLNRIADATIYVCRANYTEKDNIKYLNQLVENQRLKKVSLVINGTNAKQGYGYGYGRQSEK